MTRFASATASGTRYLYDGTRLLISQQWEEPRVIYPTRMAVVERLSIDYAAMGNAATRTKAEQELWAHIESLPWNDRPEVGKLLYAAGGDEWELSTPVTFVYFIGEDAAASTRSRRAALWVRGDDTVRLDDELPPAEDPTRSGA